jgi:PAS domain S-box-containing protein
MMQQSNESILLVDIDTKKILEVNPHCVAMFGYSEAELLSMTVYDLVADSPENITRRTEAIVTGTELSERILKIRCKDGQTIEVERAATIIQYAGKRVFMFANRDLSAERKLQGLILRDVAMASGVQKDLLPRGFDDLLVSVETVYEPHHMVSGDFFDFTWSEDHKRLSGFILDVSGHGVSSALQCIAVSTYFRDVLNSPMSLDARMKWVNRHVLRYFTHETFAAALAFEFDFNHYTLTFATAGIYGFLTSAHALPEVVKRPGSLLGILEDPEYTEWTVPIKAGDIFYFMSDGLFDVVTRSTELPTANYTHMVRLMRDIAASPGRRDDCSALCVQINDQPRFPIHLEFHRYGEYDRIRSRIRGLLQNISIVDAPKIEIALGEALANASRESMDVRVKLSLFGRLLVVRIRDGGKGFDGRQRVAAFLSTDMESEFLDRLYAEGGRGILIMMAWMDQVIYSRKGNEVMLVKQLT